MFNFLFLHHFELAKLTTSSIRVTGISGTIFKYRADTKLAKNIFPASFVVMPPPDVLSLRQSAATLIHYRKIKKHETFLKP